LLDQTFINLLIAAVGALFGWWVRTIWVDVRRLQDVDVRLTDRIAAIEVLVAGQYVRRDKFDATIDKMFQKLDRIEEGLNGKADRR